MNSPRSSAGSGPGIRDEIAHDVRVTDSGLLARGSVFDMRRDRVAFGGSEFERDYLDHTGAVAVVALDDRDRVLLIRQYRHATGFRLWEIPAGLMDAPGENGLEAARRELAEEADLAAESWALLLDTTLSPGCSSEAMRIFLARGLSPAEHDFSRTEEEAEIEPTWVPLDEAVAAALDGRFHNAVTVNAVLATEASKARGWETLRDPELPWVVRETARGGRSA